MKLSPAALARRPRALTVMALVALLCGAAVRALYALVWHPMMKFLYSDMELYWRFAGRFTDASHVGTIEDTLYPPGTPYFFGILAKVDASMRFGMAVQLALALAIPLLVYAIGKELYERRVALLAMAFASLYMPLFEYSGYILAENPFTFLLLAAFALLARSLRAETPPRTALVVGLAAGLCLGLAVSFKSAALSSALLVVLVIVARMRWGGLRAWRALGAAAVGLTIVMVPLAVRATRLNEGRFCLVANEASRGVLLGHHGDVYLAKFYDRKRDLFYEYGYSTAIERHRTGVVELNVGPWDNEKVVGEAWRWTKAHPRESLALGFEHVFDLFIAMPWPSGSDGTLKAWALYTQRAYQPLLLAPAAVALLFLAWHARARARGTFVGADLMVLAPIAGIAASAFLAVGESRYRAPFDGFLILLAARGYVAVWDAVTSRIQARRRRRPPPSPPSPAPFHPDSSP